MQVAKLDKVFSEYIRRRTENENGVVKCCTCPKSYHWKWMDAGHFIDRGHMATRWAEMNVHAQCQKCNRLLNGNMKQYKLFLLQEYGPDTIRILTDLGRSTMKYTQADVNELVKEYKSKLNGKV